MEDVFLTDDNGGYFVRVCSVSENGKFYPKNGYSTLRINIRKDLQTILTKKTYPRYSREDNKWSPLRDCKQYYEVTDTILYENNKLGNYSYIKVDKKTFAKLKLKL